MHIDSHQHFWHYQPVKDAWIDDNMRMLRRDFLPEHLEPLLKENGMDGCIAVQADQSERETEFLLRLAGQHAFIKGVVGWVDLQAAQLEKRLEHFSQFPGLKGFRHIVQAEAAGFLLRPSFLAGIRLLPAYGLTYDVLVYPHQLPEVLSFVAQVPEQKLVLDHCGKPNLKKRDLAEWATEIKKLGRFPHLFCKLSGLLTEADWGRWKEDRVFRCLDVVFEAFGVDRLLFGSDWPVLLLAGNYRQWKELLLRYLDNFSATDRQKIFGGNAGVFYQLSKEKNDEPESNQ